MSSRPRAGAALGRATLDTLFTQKPGDVHLAGKMSVTCVVHFQKFVVFAA